jgi:hypothetical protein
MDVEITGGMVILPGITNSCPPGISCAGARNPQEECDSAKNSQLIERNSPEE